MEILFYLILAHYIADYPLQGDFLATTKGKQWYSLFAHCFVYSGVVALAFKLLGVYSIWVIPSLLITHIVIDKWKTTMPFENKYLYIDQLLHIIIIIILFILHN